MSTRSRIRGALSTKDMEFIERNVDKMSEADIAESLNRNLAPIRRYIKENKLGKKYTQARELGDKTETMILKELKEKPFYKVLRKQLSVEELIYFNESWIAMLKQFSGDVFASEEMELKELLLLEIIKNRTLIDKKKWLDDREIFRRELEIQMKLPQDEKDKEHIRFLRAEINSMTTQSNDCAKTFNDLSQKSDKIRHALKASREQRLKRIDSAKINFSGWIRQLTDPEIRGKVARELEIMRMAMEKAKDGLGQYITYSNKEVDRPILTAETIKGDKNE